MRIFSLLCLPPAPIPTTSTAISHIANLHAAADAAVDGTQKLPPSHTHFLECSYAYERNIAFLSEGGSAEDESSLMTSPADLSTSPEAPQNNGSLGPDQASAMTISKRGSLRRTTVKQTGSFNLRGKTY